MNEMQFHYKCNRVQLKCVSAVYRLLELLINLVVCLYVST